MGDATVMHFVEMSCCGNGWSGMECNYCYDGDIGVYIG
jgi:hypothetical protein